MGGSFNPPTLAHYTLMKTALEAMDADLGFFVPGAVEDWKGENLLGCALMETRDWLQEK